MKQIVYTILLLTVLVSCQEDLKTTRVIIPELPTPSITVQSSIIGRVIDVDGNPLAKSEVVLGSETQLTTDLGYFTFDKATLDRYGSLITASKSGFLTGFRRVSLHAGTSNFVEFTLLSDTPSLSFESNDGATIEDEHGIKLTFPKNAISLASGQAFDGTVYVSLQFIDPTASNIISTLPGSLQGFTTEGVLTALKSYSMISVELRNEQGQELQIRTGETVEIEFPIPNSLLNNAPNNIPLWYLDEGTGLWMEEGQAVLVNDVYIGDVSHFSYWNCDVPEDFVIVEGSVCNRTNTTCEALAFSEIAVLDSDNEIRLVSQTDSEGNFTFFIPKNMAVIVDFVSMCDGSGDMINIGPYEEDQNLGQIEISTDLNSVQLQAEVFNCDGGLLKQGTLIINDNIYLEVNEGQVSEAVLVCNESDITVQAFDAFITKSSEVVDLPYSESLEASLSLCEDVIIIEDSTTIDFIRITLMNGDEEIEWAFLEATYLECGVFDDGNQSPDPDKLNLNFISGINTDPQDSSNILLFFDNGTSCESDPSEVNIATVDFKLPLSDNNYYVFGAMHPDIYFGMIEGTGLMSTNQINSYGVNPGDIISGSLTAENSLARLADISFDNETEFLFEGVPYTIRVDFKITVKE